MNNKRGIRRVITLLICIAMLMNTSSGIGVARAADLAGAKLQVLNEVETKSTELEVGTEGEWKSAIKAINEAESGEFTIKLTKDISVDYGTTVINNTTSFLKNKTTILGNGHTIVLGNYGYIGISKSAIVNLGSEDGSDILNITQDNSAEVAIMALGGELNMYDGVRIYNCNPMSGGTMASAVRIAQGGLNIYGTFHMYGGSIDSNTLKEAGFGGGAVTVEPDCKFYMHGGVIKNNKTIGSYSTMSGGVGVMGGSFYMSGGTIQNNSCETPIGRSEWAAGGVAIVPFNGPSSYFEMTGGRINNNTGIRGGGIHNDSGKVDISGGEITGNTALIGGGYYSSDNASGTIVDTVIANNSAVNAGADVYLIGKSTLELPLAKDMNQKFTGDKSNAPIINWYLDSENSRWSQSDASIVDVSQGTITGTQLIAAYHGYEVTYQFESKTEEKELPESILSLLPEKQSNIANGTTVTPSALTQTEVKIGDGTWKFEGWDKKNATINGKNELFMGTWTFSLNVEPSPTSSLTITKTVTGDAGDKSREFTFKLELSNDDSYNYTGSKSGTIASGGAIKLGHGQSITIENIPVGVTYTVRELEADKDGYTTTVKDDTGSITTEVKTASFTNYKNSSGGNPDPGNPDPGNPDPTVYGDLGITKTVTGNAGDKKREFTFEVTLSASGSYRYTGSKSGRLTSGDTVKLGHGQEITIQNIPVGTTYTVREVEADKDGYTTEMKGDTGTITTDKKTASFTNRKIADVDPDSTGELTIIKTVTGNEGDKNKEFTFKVTFDNDGTYNYAGSKSGTITSGDTVKLSHGQSITIENIPVGITYTVHEIEADKNGYTTKVKGGTGAITAAGKTAKFTNHKTSTVSPGATGDLIITKIVTGNAGSKNKEFTFKVTFDADGAYRYIGNKSGMITSGDTITLKNGQSIAILDLPAGKTYRVTELEANQGGYETTVTGGKGKILADEAVTAEFINDKSTQGKSSADPNSPQTGDDFDLFMWIGFLVLSGIGCIWGIIFKYRKTDQHKS